MSRTLKNFGEWVLFFVGASMIGSLLGYLLPSRLIVFVLVIMVLVTARFWPRKFDSGLYQAGKIMTCSALGLISLAMVTVSVVV